MTAGMGNAFALTARRDYMTIKPRVSLRYTLGYVLLRFQRVLDNIFADSACWLPGKQDNVIPS